MKTDSIASPGIAAAARRRIVLPEILDELDPASREARRARADLQRVHRAMGSAMLLRRAFARLALAAPPRRLLELGAGDATLTLRAMPAVLPCWRDVELTLLDRVNVVEPPTRARFARLGWRLRFEQVDALQWARPSGAQAYDLTLCTLFLHHFDDEALSRLLAAVARRSAAFIACEPRRDVIARAGSRLIGLLGASHVTRQDAATSVAAGFRGRELSALWPSTHRDWVLEEYRGGPFGHVFTAVRRHAQRAALDDAQLEAMLGRHAQQGPWIVPCARVDDRP